MARTKLIIVSVTSIVVLTAFAASIVHAHLAAGDWDCEPVASMTDSDWASTAMDGDGNLHLAFEGSYTDDAGVRYYGLIHGVYDGERFALERISEHHDNHGGVSLALDSSGRAHVAMAVFDYLNSYPPLSQVVYAVCDDGSWSVDVIDTSFSRCANVVIDSDEVPRVLYISGGRGLVMATQSDGVWSNVTIESEGITPGYLYGVCIDSSDRVHLILSYALPETESYDYILAYAVYDGESLTVTDLPSASGRMSLTLDSEDRPIVGLVENTTGTLRFSIAMLENGTWLMDTIGECGSCFHGGVPCVDEGADGILRAAVIADRPDEEDDLNADVLCATKLENGWVMSKIDSTYYSFHASWTTVAVDNDGFVHVLYPKVLGGSQLTQTLMHATDLIDSESKMQPFIDSGILAAVAGLTTAAVLSTIVYAVRIRRRRTQREKDFKTPVDFGDRHL